MAQPGAAGHVVLLGDSVFDNKAYVAGGPDVIAQLRARLPAGWRASLGAVDGAVTADVTRQLGRVPQEATHLVVSVGGNDALRQEPVLGEPARSVGEGMVRLGAVADRFQQDYRAMLAGILARRLSTALCTIYDPRFPDPLRQRLAIIGLALFNDVIAREAFAHGLPLIDLRLVCSEDADFANPIEPSVVGGAKIAAAIAGFAANLGTRSPRSTVHGSGAG
jgi:lysophospholipase L1-like esterase